MRENKGITLIALVITIIIMLILAGVTINLALGENGLIGYARNAKADTKQAKANEESLMAGVTDYIKDNIEPCYILATKDVHTNKYSYENAIQVFFSDALR